jgi:phosphate transport system substrate-binding protein
MGMTHSRRFLVAFVAIIVVSLAGCQNVEPTQPPITSSAPITYSASLPTPTIPLKGAGATFPAILYTKWMEQFNQLYKVPISYDAIGSSGGINAITSMTADFGASDGIMTDTQVSAAQAAGGPILHIPMTSGSVAVAFNIAGVKSGDLKLSGQVLANICLKKIHNWKDPAIAALNPSLTLPDSEIVVVHRSDGSGTTNIFTNYLSKVSADWAAQVGSANTVNWPGDVGGTGNAGVAEQVQKIPGSIGYVEQHDLCQHAQRQRRLYRSQPGCNNRRRRRRYPAG